MSAKGFLSSPAATVEQAVAWLHSRVSLTAHLKLCLLYTSPSPRDS